MNQIINLKDVAFLASEYVSHGYNRQESFKYIDQRWFKPKKRVSEVTWKMTIHLRGGFLILIDYKTEAGAIASFKLIAREVARSNNSL